MPHRGGSIYSKSAISRSKPKKGIVPACNSMMHMDENTWDQISPKCYDFRHPKSIEKVVRKNNYSLTN